MKVGATRQVATRTGLGARDDFHATSSRFNLGATSSRIVAEYFDVKDQSYAASMAAFFLANSRMV